MGVGSHKAETDHQTYRKHSCLVSAMAANAGIPLDSASPHRAAKAGSPRRWATIVWKWRVSVPGGSVARVLGSALVKDRRRPPVEVTPGRAEKVRPLATGPGFARLMRRCLRWSGIRSPGRRPPA